MQERTLGSIIMGGIAILGVVWAVIEGVPPLANAKKAEKKLEQKVCQIVKEKFDSSVEELDIKRISFTTKDMRNPGSNRPKYKAVISLEGEINNSNENLFNCTVVSSNDYILDLQNKVGANVSPAYMALEYDIYQNYSMTLSDLINTILEDETSEIQSYLVSDGLYSRLFADAGCIISAIDSELENKNNLPVYDVKTAIEKSEELKYGEKGLEEVFVEGIVKSVESRREDSTKITYYTIKLVTEGADELHEYEIYSAKLLNTSLDPEKLIPGAKVCCKGYLSKSMAYKTITK